MQIEERPSPNHEPRTRPVDLVVLHYTGMQNAEIALARLTDPAPLAGRYPGPWQAPDADPAAALARVSAHYVVTEDGRVVRCVGEDRVAWHAGISFWAGESGVNARSIGIEIVNGGHDFGLPPYPDVQIAAVIALLRDIVARHSLQSRQVVGHSDVAPARKADPGEHFPWTALAMAGVAVGGPLFPQARGVGGVGPGDAGEAVLAVQESLAALGYGVAGSGHYEDTTQAVVTAFQRRWRPDLVDGRCDEESAAIIAALTVR
jgi:N-acetylmuramoyl-L-alanine amidase